MIIEKNKVVGLSYVLHVDNAEGEVVETVTAARPLEFIYGIGQLLPKFEENIAGLKVGDTFAFQLLCEDAYGKALEEYVIDVPKNVFMVDGKIDEEILKEGNALPMMDSAGHHMNGVIVEVKDDVVVMDFNHPMAGDDLYFTGKVESVREATADELKNGLRRGCGGCGGGSCDSGNCDGGNCEGACEGGGCNK